MNVKNMHLICRLPTVLALCPVMLQAAVYGDFQYEEARGEIVITGLVDPLRTEPLVIPGAIGASVVRVIGAGAFSNCTALTSVSFPDSLTFIGESAFQGCRTVTKVTFGAGTEGIEKNAFAGCTSLTGIILPEWLEDIGEGAFEGCSSLASLIFRSELESIGDRAFTGCTALTTLRLLGVNEYIGNCAFSDCTNLVTVYMGAALETFGDSVFKGCPGLKGVYFYGDAPDHGEDIYPESDLVTSYYLAGTRGWKPLYSGRPTALWFNPLRIVACSVNRNESGPDLDSCDITVMGPAEGVFLLEACTDLQLGDWVPYGITRSLDLVGWAMCCELCQADRPRRFYRVRPQ